MEQHILLDKYIGTLDTQRASRAASHAFATSEAAVILDGDSLPGVPADIDTDRTIKHAYPALHAPARLGHYHPLYDYLPACVGYR